MYFVGIFYRIKEKYRFLYRISSVKTDIINKAVYIYGSTLYLPHRYI